MAVDRVVSGQRTGVVARADLGPAEQFAERVEITQVDELGVAEDEVLDLDGGVGHVEGRRAQANATSASSQ